MQANILPSSHHQPLGWCQKVFFFKVVMLHIQENIGQNITLSKNLTLQNPALSLSWSKNSSIVIVKDLFLMISAC